MVGGVGIGIGDVGNVDDVDRVDDDDDVNDLGFRTVVLWGFGYCLGVACGGGVWWFLGPLLGGWESFVRVVCAGNWVFSGWTSG